jgi:hypothetical protein
MASFHKYSILFRVFVLLAVWLPVFSYPDLLKCSQVLEVGEPLMEGYNTVALDPSRTVVVTRGSTVLTDLKYVRGETLGVALSDTSDAQYIFEAINAHFVDGLCDNIRSQVNAPAQLVMPSSGDVSVFSGWQTEGPADVLITPPVTLTPLSVSVDDVYHNVTDDLFNNSTNTTEDDDYFNVLDDDEDDNSWSDWWSDLWSSLTSWWSKMWGN